MKEKTTRGKIKVLFVIHYLGGGGAERVIVRILRSLSREKFVPVLLMMENKGVFRSEVPRDVPVLDCGRYGAGGRWRWLVNFVRILRQEKPDVVVSFLWFTNLVAVMCRFVSGISCKLILSERSTIVGSREGFKNESIRRLSILSLYRTADCIIPNSDGLRRQLMDRYHIPARMLRVIPNPLDIDAIYAKRGNCVHAADKDDALPMVVGIGRLSREKGFDLLIRAAAEVRIPFRLALLGEGPEENNLRELAVRMGIDDRIEFAGFQENPYTWLGGAALFVLPSRYEGFPNALLEAMALGVACIATRCPTGPEEIVTDGKNGLLVPVEDPKELATAITRLLEDVPLRETLALAGREVAREFDVARVLPRFEALIEELTA